ncbi:MAG: UDP-glucose/GDP-mannose dehydrogenase family protein [Bacillota bacterium]|nr:UDP-glucose/GDP-mannose dehydrogenase family protein [Bacillota bacterium]
MDICVIGLGPVGLIHGTSMAEIGHSVYCVDRDAGRVEMLNKGITPFYEEGLEDMVNRNLQEGRLSFSTDIGSAIRKSSVIFICVGSPMGSDGSADLSQVTEAVLSVSKNLNGYKVVVVKSTVPVGTSAAVKRIIQQNRTESNDVDVVSNPEFLREGSGIYDTFNGDRIVIGSSSPVALRILRQLYQKLNVPVITVSPESAEMIKYASNTFLAAKISFINEIANICDRVGADIDEVAMGMGMDSRIGNRFLKAGLGFGGSCFPKDVNAIIRMAEKKGYEFRIAKQVLEVNERQKLIPVKVMERHLGDLAGKTISVLGLSFKPDTDDMRFAPSIDLIKALTAKGCRVKAYDPVVQEGAELVPGGTEVCADLYGAVEGCHGIVLVTEWKEFVEMDLERVARLVREPIFVDGRNCMDADRMRSLGFIYCGIGR